MNTVLVSQVHRITLAPLGFMLRAHHPLENNMKNVMEKSSGIKTLCVTVSALMLSSFAQAAVTDLVTNGGFETGDFSGWTQIVAGSQTISAINPSSGTYSANLSNSDPSANLLQQFGIGTGLLSAGQAVDISIDYRGIAEAGGVLFVELFSINGVGGVTKSELLGGAPLLPVGGDPNAWSTATFSTTIGPDVTNGLTLQLNVACGAAAGCVSDYFIDNISLTADVATVPVPAAAWLFGSALLGVIGLKKRTV